MNSSSPNPDLGPLPGNDRNAQLQQLSIKALSNALPEERFVFRGERDIDAGVDGTLELINNAAYTNLRAQVQLKGTDSDRLNQDGSYSLQVDVSNLNYLLNGFNPIYIVYIVPRKELRYLWAHEERKRAEGTNADWMQQQTITLRFERVLTPTTLDEIYDRVLKEGRFQRSIIETLSRSVPTEQAVIGITPETLQHTDPNHLRDILEKSGVVLVASGYAIDVLGSLNLLNPSVTNLAYFQLLRTYADYTLARYDDALGAAKKALLKRTELSVENQQFLDFLKDSCDLQTGRITLQRYIKKKAEWQHQLTGVYALSQKLDYLTHAILATNSVEEGTKLRAEVCVVAEQIVAAPNVSIPSKLQARIAMLYAEGQQFLFDFLQDVATLSIRISIPCLLEPQRDLSRTEQLNIRWTNWLDKMHMLLHETVQQHYPLLLAEIMLYSSIIVSAYLANCQFISIGKDIAIPIEANLFAEARKMADQAAQIYQKANNLEGEIHARLTSAELIYLAGEKEAAVAIAEEVYPIAQTMDYANLAARAEEYIKGQSLLGKTLERIQLSKTLDGDFSTANQDDEDMKQAAKLMLVASGLPENRLPVMERMILSARDIAHERVEWCRHIELLEDLTHTQNRSTYYRTSPDRVCQCSKHKYQSLISNPDWRGVIVAFKQSFCANCPDRNPKR